MSGSLFVVATPIGNLEDITLRALRVLREVDVIAAEDTRRTARLLSHYSIATLTQSFHQHNIRTRLPHLMQRLEQGGTVALVTDAGTPSISDPGVELVQAAIERAIRVEPVPGASAPLAAAVASGFPLEPLTIFGFAPSRAKARSAWMSEIAAIRHTCTFFEAPHRIEATLHDAVGILGKRQIVIARELTKVHEEVVRGFPIDLIGRMANIKGEFTVVIGPAPVPLHREQTSPDADIYDEFRRSANNVGPGGRRQVIVGLASKYGRSTRDVYGIIERLKKEVV